MVSTMTVNISHAPVYLDALQSCYEKASLACFLLSAVKGIEALRAVEAADVNWCEMR